MKNNISETNRLYSEISDGLAEGAIHAAFAYLQAQLKTTHPSFAVLYLDDTREKVLKDLFNTYIKAQISFDISHGGK